MKGFRFLEWKVYHDAKELASLVLRIVKKIPAQYRYELGSQMIRSSLSVALNIAEGSGKHSDIDMNRFFNIALGSLNETLAVADILHYNKLITFKEFEELRISIVGINNQLGGFKKKLKNSQ